MHLDLTTDLPWAGSKSLLPPVPSLCLPPSPRSHSLSVSPPLLLLSQSFPHSARALSLPYLCLCPPSLSLPFISAPSISHSLSFSLPLSPSLRFLPFFLSLSLAPSLSVILSPSSQRLKGACRQRKSKKGWWVRMGEAWWWNPPNESPPLWETTP